VKAVVTAGGRIDGAFSEAAGTNVKALAPIGGATMLQRIVEALRGAGATQIAVIGGEEVRAACAAQVDRVVDESPSGAENLLRALRAWPDDGGALLYATSDLPFITSGAVRDFADRVTAGALAIALVDFAVFDARFPKAPAAGITLAGERVVNGGLFSIPEGSAPRLAATATRLFDARKAPWRMASLVNPLVLIRYFLGTLSIAHLEKTAQRVMGVPARAVRDCAPELAFDVDTIAEFEYARAQR
jgi:GTP:adenosylcobinamide-phosphate guanylyltransferase